MSIDNFTEVNTKLKAYKLVHDPTVLLSLIYSKYGDIEEDFELLYINQLIYDKSSRYNTYFKEYNYYFSDDEYLKRYYKKYESKPRIPKLSDYYKNYHVFFCRPRFKDLVFSDLIQSYEDDRAEIFYKNNFENSNSKDDDKDKSQKHNSDSLSSLDNITYNKIIFTKKTKKMIDNNLDSNCGTLTLTSNSINNNLNNNSIIKNDKNEKNEKNNYIIKKVNNNDGLISSRNANDSFEKIVHNLVVFKKNKKKNEKNNKNKNNNNIKVKEKNKIKEEKGYAPNKNNKKTNHKNHNISKKKTNLYINNNKRNNKISFFSLLKQANTINYTKQNKININNNNNLNNEFFSPKINFQTKLEEFHNNLLKKNNTSHHQRNKTFNYNQNQTTGINNNNYTNYNNLINANKNNSRNDLKNNNIKQMVQLNNFLTVNNNLLTSQKTIHNNKTFDNSPIINNNNSLIKKKSKKPIHKNCSASNNDNINNQITIKRNNLIKSKFNLVKSPLNHRNINNKINLNKNVKNNNFKYYNTKFSPSNIFYRNLINNNINSHKKCQTTYFSPELEGSPNNKVGSPKIINNPQKQYYNINKSDNITSKIKPKIVKGRINNLNINFNNVIFNGPLSGTNENININNNIVNNNSHSFNIISNSNNNHLKNNTFLNNINFLNNSSNIINNNMSDSEHANDKNIYIMNLKNVYNNISRNKIHLYGTSFSQTDNFSLTKTNTKKKNDKNTINNHTYSNLLTNEKQISKKKKILNQKLNYKSGNQRNSKKIIKNNMKKSKKI